MSHSKATSMSKDEAMILVQLVAANKIITTKATNATNNKLKEQAWEKIANMFNSSVVSCPRTATQLRLKWENLKKSARKRCASVKSSLNKTGGGKGYFPPDELLDTVASILGNTCTGFTVEFGGDATDNATIDMSDVTIEGVVTVDGDGGMDGDCGGGGSDGVSGDGVSGGGVGREVLKEVQFLEAPPPKQTNYFLKASGSNSLAKRKHKLEEEKCKARISRENALAEYLVVKKKKLEMEIEEKKLNIEKLKLEIENLKK